MSLRKVAIVAKAGTSALAPWHDESWEIWGLPWIKYPRVDAFFDMHDQGFYDTESACSWQNESWVKDIEDQPVFSFSSRSHLPNYRPYPFEEIISSLPIPYLENSIAYMLALAIHQRADVIGLYGVHMRGQYEYEAERPSIAYLVGLAQGLGIDIVLPPGNPLFLSVWEEGFYGKSLKKRTHHPAYTGLN